MLETKTIFATLLLTGAFALPFAATTAEASDCDPKALKRYCAYRSKCRADERSMSWMCKKGDKFVARIPKTKKFAVKQCRTIRAKIRKICEPRGR